MFPGLPHFGLWLLAAVSGLAEALLIGYVPIALLLLAGRLLQAKHWPLWRSLTVFANTWLLLGAVLFLLTALYQLLTQLRSGDEYEQYVALSRITGPYWFAYVGAVLGKGLLPQVLWRKRLRRRLVAVGLLVPLLLIDFWLPLLYSSLHRDYLPGSWAMQPDYRGLVVGLVVVGAGYLAGFAVWRLAYRAIAARRRQP